jgi:hypothetical protein
MPLTKTTLVLIIMKDCEQPPPVNSAIERVVINGTGVRRIICRVNRFRCGVPVLYYCSLEKRDDKRTRS